MKFPKKVAHKRKPKIKKVKKTTLKRKCDILFSKLIRSLDHCERDGELKNLQTAHIYSRRILNLRYDPQNVLCLCSRCHFWMHQNPLEAMAWFNKAYPDRAEYLIKKRNTIEKIDYNKILKDLQEF